MTYYSKIIIMNAVKFVCLWVFICLLASCYKEQYTEYEQSFFSIYLKEWNSSICPKKVVFEKYVKNSNFKDKILSNADFDINGCEKKQSQFNQRILTPKIFYKGQINYDIKLIIDDSLEFRITRIQNKLDTVPEKAGPKKWVIMNNINSLVVNG